MSDPTFRIAAVSAVGVVATSVAGAFVRDRLTAVICLTVAGLSLAAIVLAYWSVKRQWRKEET